MNKLVLALSLTFGTSAMAGLFDTTAEVTVKYLYKQASKGNLSKFVGELSGEAREQFGNPEGVKTILADLEKGKIVTDGSLTAERKEDGVYYRSYRVNAFGKNGSTKTLVRQFDLDCAVTSQFECHGSSYNFEHCGMVEYENCSVIAISK